MGWRRDREVTEELLSKYLVIRERNQSIDQFTLTYSEREVGPGNGSVIFLVCYRM